MNTSSNGVAVLLIDMQEFFLQHFDKHIRKELVDNQISVLNFCIKNKLPIIATEYKCRGIFRGHMITTLHKKLGKALAHIVVKESNSGFTKTELDQVLKDLKVKRLLIMGINANACVQDTTIGAISRGYKVLISKGIIASAGRKDLEISKRNMKWYKAHSNFFETPKELIIHLER